MDIDVQKMTELTTSRTEVSSELQKEQVKVEQQRKADQQNIQNQAIEKENRRKAKSRAATDQYMRQVLNISNVLNRKLSYSVNKELNQVVVKVIDSKTDKVIRVIPSEALLKLHSRMKEVIGLIFDEEI
ncbi:MAG: flagellar protein FlaG [Spirochaetales bacterium]|nr:flagellar protein FlaG [Spirochaetales bacterium]